MFQEYWEEYDINCEFHVINLFNSYTSPTPYFTAGRHGRISTHVTSLLTLLRSHLFHHRFTEATPIIETLAAATDRAPGIVWRVRHHVTFNIH